VWGSAEDDVYASGDAATLLHFDGAAWSPVVLPAALGVGATALTDVWGSAANDVYVAAERAVLRFDGTEWTDITPPDDPGDANPFRSVFATGPTDVYVTRGRLSHFDGAAWTEPEGDVLARAIHGLSPDRVVAAFAGVWLWDGATWTDTRQPVATYFESVVMTSPTEVYAIGPDAPLSRLALP
jgi:hypothetical protein